MESDKRKIYDQLRLKGEFELSSGQISQEYFDSFLGITNPEFIREIAHYFKPIFPEWRIDLLAGPESAGSHLAASLSPLFDKPYVVVRKERKKHGTKKIIEGPEVSGQRTCLFEGTVTTGETLIKSARHLREEGALVDLALCIVLRDRNAIKTLSEEGIKLRYIISVEKFKDEHTEN